MTPLLDFEDEVDESINWLGDAERSLAQEFEDDEPMPPEYSEAMTRIAVAREILLTITLPLTEHIKGAREQHEQNADLAEAQATN